MKDIKKHFEDFQKDLLTIKSLDKHGYPNIITSNIEILSKSDVGHNAPLNVNFGNKNGYYKNSTSTSDSSFDKFEFVICQIGKMFNIKMAETYKVFSDNYYLGIISENVCNYNETLYMYSTISKFINKDSEEIKKILAYLENLSSKEKDYKIPIVESPEDIQFVIDSFLQAVRLLKIPEEEQRKIRQDYFNMIILDFIVNNVDRAKDNYGLIINEYGEVRFAPLFDNSTIYVPKIPKGYQQINGFFIAKNNLLDCLYKNYYEDIKSITQTCLHNRESLNNKVYDLCSKELDPEEQSWFLGTFNENLNMVVDKELGLDDSYEKTQTEQKEESNESVNEVVEPVEEGPKLVRTKPISSNEGKINLIMILLVVSLIFITTTLLILFKIY